MTLHIPILRFGEAYESLDHVTIRHSATGADLAQVSQANVGLIAKDMGRLERAHEALRAFDCEQLVAMIERAADIYMEADLPMGLSAGADSQTTPVSMGVAAYIEHLSATSGLPHRLCRKNMGKIHKAMSGMTAVLNGLTRNLDLSIIDKGFGEHQGQWMSFIPEARALGVVAPSNSPGVHSIWLPALALKTPVLIKPGREEPWTPMRVIQAMIKAGIPKQAFGFYPTSHEGADHLLRHSGRGILFGGDATTKKYQHNPAIEIHGTGRSKILIGEDWIDRWPEFMDILVESVSSNGGRSCVNTSCIVVPRHGRAIAEALAKRLVAIEARGAEDPEAELSAFANVKMAGAINTMIDRGLEQGGATDMTRVLRQGSRLVEREGWTFLLPTVLFCESFEQPLSNTEFLFPYVSVVELPQDQMIEQIGPSLVVSLLTEDQSLLNQALRSPHIDRLNVGAMASTKVQWDQPHEGNLFDHLYRRRAVQVAAV